MFQSVSSSSTKLDKAMSQEQFNQVVEAIVEGKYSWACVLILRFAGYNPLHYIPYRTYNRLLKDNCQIGRSSRAKPDNIHTNNQNPENLSKAAASGSRSTPIKDLAYLEVIGQQQADIRGGYFANWLDIAQEDNWLSEDCLLP